MAADLLLRLRELDVKVRIEGDRVRLTPEKSVPADLRAEIAAREAELVRFLRDVAPGLTAAPARAIEPVPRNRRLPLSFAQQRFWFLEQLGEQSSVLNMILALRLRGALDAAALRWSLDEIVRRHETMRTTIGMTDGEPHLVIAKAAGCGLRTVDLAGREDREDEVERITQEEYEGLFDIAEGPLYRMVLLVLGPDEHVLLVTMHHMITDRWSWGVFCDELSALYGARIAGRPSPLQPLRVQYADHACWQRDWYEREAGRLAAYWKETLRGVATLELPTDRPRPPTQTFRGGKTTFRLSRAALDGVSALGRREGCTFFMTTLAAFQLLLARYTGQDDIAVGTPVANRNDIDVEPLLGLFLNSLVLRADLSGDLTFRELLGRTKALALEAYEHQEMPFEQLVVELRPERDLSRNPLFQVLFNLLEDTPPPALGDLDVQPIVPETVAAMFDLSLVLEETGDEVVGLFQYNRDLFDEATIERMGQHYGMLLEAVVADPDRSVWDIPLLTEPERRLTLAGQNDTARDYPADRTLPQLLEERVARSPDAVAAECGGARLTYAELNTRANRLAHHLRGLGAGPDRLVGISVERSLDMLVGLLGILKSGAAYVPLDPSYPRDRLAFILEDAGIELLVTQESLRSSLPERLPELVRLDADADAIAAQRGADPEHRSGPDHLAYVIFTSGSTGRPKGVQIEHRALVNFLCSMAERPGMTADDVLVAVTTISFDIAGLELYLPLLVGGRVVIASGGAESDGRSLARLLQDSGATILQATPGTWTLLLEADWRDPDLVALCGGEALPRELAEQLLPRCRRLWNMYGPTETTIWSLAHPVESGTGPVPIAGPIANTEVYLLDRRGQPVPVGVPGALHLGGAGLARGYWNRAELTAEKFVPHPFSDQPGARLYDTGDLARYRADGGIEFLGRADHQVKIRGFRIELGEIEHVLAQRSSIKECAVVARPKASGDRQLVAHVAFHPGATSTVSELRRALREKLPDYMVPPAFVMHGDLPRTPNGKIDRKTLARARQVSTAGEERHEPPRTAMEKLIAGIWSELLEVDRIGVQDNFFDLGGHSLLAMKVVFRVEKQIGQKVFPMDLLLQNLEQFAELCAQRQTREDAPADKAPPGLLGRLGQKLSRLGKGK